LTHQSTAFLQGANQNFGNLLIIIQKQIHVGYQQSKYRFAVLCSRELIYNISHSHVNSRGTAPEQSVEHGPIAPTIFYEF